MPELAALPATELAARIAARKASPVEILESHLAVIGRRNPGINAICTLDAEAAFAEARAIETALMKGQTLGPLQGLPIGIKDVTPTRNLRTTYGSPLHADHVPEADAAIVARLRQAGAIILAKTNTPEFAAGANTVNAVFGATRNPYDLTRSAGGSTGGGAAALASDMIPLAQGTDFGGSLRVPAAFCGVAGLRPTAGLTPGYPAPSPFDTGQVNGPMARNVADLKLLFAAMLGDSPDTAVAVPPPWPSLSLPETQARALRLAYAPDLAGIGAEPAIARAIEAALVKLASTLAIEPVDFTAADGKPAYRTLRGHWMAVQHYSRLDRVAELGPNLRGNIEAGLATSIRELAAAEHKRAEIWHRFRRLFTRYDILLTPTVTIEPFPVTTDYPETVAGRKLATYIDWIAPTYLVTLAGLPALSIPCGLTENGFPAALQLIGPRFSEPRLFALAALMEAELPPPRPPPTE